MLRLLSETVKAVMKNIIDTSVFTLVKFITALEATNLIGYIFKEISKKENTLTDKHERTLLWSVRCNTFLHAYAH